MTKDVDAALRKGELKFTLAGEKLKGSLVLVRMSTTGDHGKRNNWLLIKHRDGYAREDDSDAVLAEDRSIASGRTMEQIAAGKGRGPKPFMTAEAKDPIPMPSGTPTGRAKRPLARPFCRRPRRRAKPQR